MRPETKAALNAINRRFYHQRAEEFSETRERPWRGWAALFDRMAPPSTVLDVGCGNGRLARFARQRLGDGVTYVGIDSSPLALAEARRRLGADVELIEHDVLEGKPLPTSLEGRTFDLVALFGVLHHIPSMEGRMRLIQQIAPCVGSRLAITVWLFDRFERFQAKLVPWEAFVEKTGTPVDESDLEPGDHIMTWGNDPVGYRYCHALSEDEEAQLIESSGLELVDRFEPPEEPNRYLVLGRAEP